MTCSYTPTAWAMGCVWPIDMASVFSCHSDGKIQLLAFGTTRGRAITDDKPPLWQLAASPAHPDLLGAVGDDGTIFFVLNVRDLCDEPTTRIVPAIEAPFSLHYCDVRLSPALSVSVSVAARSERVVPRVTWIPSRLCRRTRRWRCCWARGPRSPASSP